MNGMPAVEVQIKGQPKTFTPEEISAMILREMKTAAEAYLDDTVTRAVIAVPANFNDTQRRAIVNAGRIAGLEVVRLINGPIAAAVAIILEMERLGQNILVYDLGGGSIDASVLSIDDKDVWVISSAGDAHLGGEDFDQRVINRLVEHYNNANDFDITKDLQAMGKLRREAEKAKIALSSQTSVSIEIASFHNGKTFSDTLSRAEFERMNEDLFEKILQVIQRAIDDYEHAEEPISTMILVGGSSSIPKLDQLLEKRYGKKIGKSANSAYSVLYGAVAQGGVLSGDETLKEYRIRDVNPLPLSVVSAEDDMAQIIDRYTRLPVQVSKIFTTTSDNDDTIEIQVYEGKQDSNQNNNLLGHFWLDNIPMAPRGVPQIEATFEVSADAILSVTAIDLSYEKSITVSDDRYTLSEEDIERMKNELQNS
ncbi:ATPase with role in protein import into the ER [Podila verticillata]|nr:ATPase with role in protein import into the ER [Podila verticillata]